MVESAEVGNFHLRKVRPCSYLDAYLNLTSPPAHRLTSAFYCFYLSLSIHRLSFFLILCDITGIIDNETMDRRIFDQLDTLERGACIERRPRRDAYLDDRHEHAAYDARVSDYGYGHDAGRGYGYGGEEFVNQPMVLDSFGTPDFTTTQYFVN